MIKSAPGGILRKTDSGGGIALGIAIDQKRSLLRESQRSSEVNRGGRLADPALLIGNCDDTAQITSPQGAEFSTLNSKYANCFTWNNSAVQFGVENADESRLFRSPDWEHSHSAPKDMVQDDCHIAHLRFCSLVLLRPPVFGAGIRLLCAAGEASTSHPLQLGSHRNVEWLKAA